MKLQNTKLKIENLDPLRSSDPSHKATSIDWRLGPRLSQNGNRLWDTGMIVVN